MWGLDEALALVRRLQPMTRRYNYHAVVGGGVINNGSSEKDLDLYFLPLDNGKREDHVGLLRFLATTFGLGTDLGGDEYGDSPVYKSKIKFHYEGRRIDAFVV